MPDYQRGKIYKIVADETDAVYIGSTTKKTLADRMSHHRADYRSWRAGTFHRITSFELLQYPSAKIILIELYPCNSKDELTARERFHIENTPTCVNKHRQLNRTPEEARQYAAQYGAQYRQDRADTLKQYRARRNAGVLCECGAIISGTNLANHRKSKKHALAATLLTAEELVAANAYADEVLAGL